MPVAAPTRPRSVVGPSRLHNWPILLCVETDYVRIPEAHSRFPGSHPAIPPYALLRPLNAATETPTSLLAEPAGLAELHAQMAQQRAACADSHASGNASGVRAAQTLPRGRQRSTPRRESWRARRRCAAKIDALTAQNAKLAAANTELAAAFSDLTTKMSALVAENAKVVARCGAAVNATATSEASLQEGNAHSRARACALTLCEYAA